MLHDALTLLAGTPDAPSSKTSDTVVIAIIGAAALVLSTVIPALLAWSRREPPDSPPAHPLNSDDDDDNDAVRARVRVLETWLWRHHIDPNRIVYGDEEERGVRFH